jgi:predicted unusual protein kinase regulating ubiquinone biosynthesis (AarF/ABC1/UbiB family)
MQIATACAHLEHVYFPQYYPEFSNNKVLVMDYIRGKHLKEYLETNPTQEQKNSVAQALWNFYEFQLHEEKAIHADPHPGNFLFDDNGNVGVIDFGCVKVVPEDFYVSYFPLLIAEIQANKPLIEQLLRSIEIIFPGDSSAVESELTSAFLKMTTLLSRPFRSETFHFTDSFLDEIYAMGEEIYQIPEVRRPTQPRGSKHALYINRTYFGIYSIMSDLNAEIKTGHGDWRERLMSYHGVLETT